MSDDNKYRQLAMFGTIVGEVVITPSGMGFFAHLLTRNTGYHFAVVIVAVFLGLGVAFYRIYLLNKKWSKNDQS